MKKTLNYLAAFVAGALITGWAYTTNDNSAQDAADYAATHAACKAGQR